MNRQNAPVINSKFNEVLVILLSLLDMITETLMNHRDLSNYNLTNNIHHLVYDHYMNDGCHRDVP